MKADAIAERRVHARRYPFTLSVVPRSPAFPAMRGAGQCWLDALDASYECAGCGRLPQEGCLCVAQAVVVPFPAPRRAPGRVAA